jgi:hypothetical protein
MEGEFYKIDFHIHTPESTCCKVGKTDDVYFKILEQAKAQNLDIIAITDHNTVSGYKKILELKERLSSKISILQELEGCSSKVNEVINECRTKLELYNDITIFPGVEITLNPGIHMLVITSPDRYMDLSDLLDSIGYENDKRGSDSDFTITTDIMNFLTNPLLTDKLIIAPHIDSDKGIYNCLSGQFRAQIFRSNSIHAMTCNSPTQKEHIQILFQNDPNYTRSFPLAFINASDAHKPEDVGTKVSFIKLPSITIEDIKSSFLNPDNNVSDISDQNLEKHLSRIIAHKNALAIEKLDNNDSFFISHYLCACLNEGIRYFIIGINSENKLIGIKKDKDELEKLISDSLDSISSNFYKLSYSVVIEKMGNGCNIAIVNLNPIVSSLWYMEDTKDVYILNRTPQIATILEIETLVKENTLSELYKLESKNNKIADNMVVQLASIKNTIDKYDLLEKIDASSVPLLSQFSVVALDSFNFDHDFIETNFSNNGLSFGNVYYVVKNNVRLSDAILRYSCPLSNIPTDLADNYYALDENSIIVAQNGGTHIALAQRRIVGVETDFLILQPKGNFPDNLSILSVLAWLKSSLFLWYVYKKFDSTNLYLPEIMEIVVIPISKLSTLNSKLEPIISSILKEEEFFLSHLTAKETCKLCKSCDDDTCPILDKVTIHNTNIANYTHQIDNIIFEALDISQECKNFIKEDLIAAEIYSCY